MKTPEDDLIDFMLNYSDIFGGYIGYWGRGMRTRSGGFKAWLIVEHDGLSYEEADELLNRSDQDLAAGKPVVSPVHLLDQTSAKRVIEEGKKKYGEKFADNYDATMLDVAIQRALLGEVRYG